MSATLEERNLDTELDSTVMCEFKIQLRLAVEASHCDRRLLMLNPCYSGCRYGIECPYHPDYNASEI